MYFNQQQSYYTINPVCLQSQHSRFSSEVQIIHFPFTLFRSTSLKLLLFIIHLQYFYPSLPHRYIHPTLLLSWSEDLGQQEQGKSEHSSVFDTNLYQAESYPRGRYTTLFWDLAESSINCGEYQRMTPCKSVVYLPRGRLITNQSQTVQQVQWLQILTFAYNQPFDCTIIVHDI